MVIWGTGFYGRVDRVPGLFVVATRFLYLEFVPLFPLESWVILEGTQRGENFSGVKLRLNLKSILVAWLRTILVVGMGVGAVWLLIAWMSSHHEGVLDGPLGGSAVLGGSIFGYWVSTVCCHATEARALQLAAKLGIDLNVIHTRFGGEQQVSSPVPVTVGAWEDE